MSYKDIRLNDTLGTVAQYSTKKIKKLTEFKINQSGKLHSSGEVWTQFASSCGMCWIENVVQGNTELSATHVRKMKTRKSRRIMIPFCGAGPMPNDGKNVAH